METKELTAIQQIAEINYITPENSSFKLTKNGFVVAKIGNAEDFSRVFLSRAFPHDLPDEFISVSDSEQNELGIIRSVGDFDDESAKIIKAELERKYFSAKILKIVNVEEKFGNSTWTVETPQGMRVMSLKDTFKSIIRIGEDRAVVIDEDANRYEIESLSKLDKASFRRIELYL
ncbi:MAG: DUF1854 domain-containing protein [Clostridia bacterium]|nr:DUF1854 domain-containing protein [Clostridia bacterium]